MYIVEGVGKNSETGVTWKVPSLGDRQALTIQLTSCLPKSPLH